MLSDSDLEALIHIRDAISATNEFTGGLDFETFDQKTFFACTRALEIVSEASRRLSPALKARHPAIPWTDIAGASNIYRHDYEDVAEHYVWSTVREALPPLQRVIEAELGHPQ